MPEDSIETPYGELRADALDQLRAQFDTRRLLKAVDEIDHFCGAWKRQLRDELLGIHAMAHTLTNDAPLVRPPGQECLTSEAAEVASEFRDWQQCLRIVIALLDQLADSESE